MFDGEEDEFPPAKEIQHQVVVHHKFPEVIGLAKERPQLSDERARFARPDGVLQESPSRVRIAGEQRDDVVEEAVEQAPKRGGPFGF